MKNSPASKSQPSPNQNRPRQTLEVKPPEPPPLNEQERQELMMLRREKGELSMMLWEAVRKASPDTHTLELPTHISDPLWLIAFVPGSKDGTTTILAGSIPPITEQEKKRVVRLLRGTNKPMEEALRELELRHPPSYVEDQIKDFLRWTKPEGAESAGRWESVRPPGLGERVKNALHLPK